MRPKYTLPTPGERLSIYLHDRSTAPYGHREVFAARGADPFERDGHYIFFIIFKSDDMYCVALFNIFTGLHQVDYHDQCADAFTDYNSRAID